MAWVRGTLKHFKRVHIKIVKQQLSKKRPFGGVRVPWFLLFNDKKMKREGRGWRNLTRLGRLVEKGWNSLGASLSGNRQLALLAFSGFWVRVKKVLLFLSRYCKIILVHTNFV